MKKDINGMLIDNFVSLQKVLTNLSVKLDELTNKISKLLELFEISAKVLAEKGAGTDSRKVEEKMNILLDQNRTIARGLALVHERMPKEMPEPANNFEEPNSQNKNFDSQSKMTGEYQKSMPVGKSSFSSVRDAGTRKKR